MSIFNFISKEYNINIEFIKPITLRLYFEYIYQNLFLWITIILVVLLLFNLFQNGNSSRVSTELAYSDFVSSVKAGNIREVQYLVTLFQLLQQVGEQLPLFHPRR